MPAAKSLRSRYLSCASSRRPRLGGTRVSIAVDGREIHSRQRAVRTVASASKIIHQLRHFVLFFGRSCRCGPHHRARIQMNVEAILRNKGRAVATIAAATDDRGGARGVARQQHRRLGRQRRRRAVSTGSSPSAISCTVWPIAAARCCRVRGRGDDPAGGDLQPGRQRRRSDGRDDQPPHPPPAGRRRKAGSAASSASAIWSRAGSTRSSTRPARCARSSPAPEPPHGCLVAPRTKPLPLRC